ncbi:TetR/AcrR family transcriptional regulator [Lysinibacillus xylanilyticus]|uniref:TetR/AcrR family transcriptional regulator n=1 Tax=Lysinibacillus xylanilyticus TaxID=582475 RepID=UPI0038197FD6
MMAFSEVEKKNIKERLILSCEESWAMYGYKKTNIEDLCLKSGISKGSFYLFYSSKEELFFDVMLLVQKRLVDVVESELGQNPDKNIFTNAVKILYREFAKIPFMRETQSPDFIALMNKLSSEKLKELEGHTSYDIRDLVRSAGLKYKIEEQKGLSALGFVFTPLPEEQRKVLEQLDTIDFIIDALVDKIFY